MRKVFATTLMGATMLLAHPQIQAQTHGKTDKSEPAKSTQGPEHNTRWTVKVTPDKAAAAKGEKAFDDTIVFADGKVSMTECVKHGFAASDYKVSKSGANWSFKTEQTSAKEGKSAWNGEVSGKTVKGTLVCTKSDGMVVNYTFEGKAATTTKEPEKKKTEDPKPKDSGKSNGGKKKTGH